MELVDWIQRPGRSFGLVTSARSGRRLFSERRNRLKEDINQLFILACQHCLCKPEVEISYGSSQLLGKRPRDLRKQATYDFPSCAVPCRLAWRYPACQSHPLQVE